MQLDRFMRDTASVVYLADPVMRARLKREACQRHARYFEWLRRTHRDAGDKITEDEFVRIGLDHERMLHWFFDLDGWRECF